MSEELIDEELSNVIFLHHTLRARCHICAARQVEEGKLVQTPSFNPVPQERNYDTFDPAPGD